MNNQKIKLLIISLLLAAIFFTIVSCGGTAQDKSADETTSGNISETESETTSLSPNVPDDIDYNGETITIFSNNYNDYCMALVEEQNGEILNDARYRMQQETEEKLHVKITEVGYGSTDLINAVSNMVNAGDNGCDIACNLARYSVELMTKGIAYNMADYDYIDLNAEYWTPNINESSLLGNSVYYAATGFNLAMYTYTSCTIFNTDLAEALSISPESLYNDVRNQKWTYVKMLEYMTSATSDINGDGVMDDGDRWGLTAYDWNTFASSVYVSGGALTVGKANDGSLALTWDTEQFYNTLETAYKIYHGSDAYTKNARNDSTIFNNGKALFLNGFFYTLNMLSDMEDDFGILPCPKYDENQSNYINLTTDSIFAVIPFCAKDPERSAAVLEVMSFMGHNYVLNAYTETTLLYKKTRDTASAEMVRLCLDTAKMDLGTIYASNYCGWDAIFNGIITKSGDFTVSSYIASQDAVNQELQKVMDSANAISQ